MDGWQLANIDVTLRVLGFCGMVGYSRNCSKARPAKKPDEMLVDMNGPLHNG